MRHAALIAALAVESDELGMLADMLEQYVQNGDEALDLDPEDETLAKRLALATALQDAVTARYVRLADKEQAA